MGFSVTEVNYLHGEPCSLFSSPFYVVHICLVTSFLPISAAFPQPGFHQVDVLKKGSLTAL